MIMRVLLAALLAGIAAALVMSAVQHWKVTPLIIAAEQFEGSAGHDLGNHGAEKKTEEKTESSGGHDHGSHEHWVPEGGFQRTLFTVISNMLAGVAFSLVLAGVMIFAGFGTAPGTGVFLGFLGFVTFSLAPAIGLSPELPGMPAGDLGARQIWWWAAVIATGAGMACIALLENVAFKALGVVIAALPHIAGAPHPSETASAVPAVLAAQFAANSLATAALFWVVLGVCLCWCLNWQKVETE